MSARSPERRETKWSGVYLLMDPETEFSGGHSHPYPAPGMKDGASGRLVHVVSVHAGGEIRSYVLSGDWLYLDSHGGSGRWLEMDAEVCGVLCAPLVQYEITEAGRIVPVPAAPQLALPMGGAR